MPEFMLDSVPGSDGVGRPGRRRGGRSIAWAVWLMLMVVAAGLNVPCMGVTPGAPGVITVTVEGAMPIDAAWAVERRFTAEGVYEGKANPGIGTGTTWRFDGLPPGQYFLRFKTGSGTVEGWDAAVPASDYIEEQPLSESDRAQILDKLSKAFATGFDDHVVVLDVQGNIQNAAVLLSQLRTRPFVGGGYRAGEWVYRVTRWQYANPHGDTWAPDLRRPYYALVRRRVRPEVYRELHVIYARHLGGITLTASEPGVDLGTIVVPAPKPGIHTVHPDGSFIAPIVLKSSDAGARVDSASNQEPVQDAKP